MSEFAKDFEELEIYKSSKRIVLKIYELTNQSKFNKDFALREQIRRAGISIISNIAEGFDRNSNKEFLVFLNYAKGSNGEVRAQMDIAYNIGYISEDEYKQMKQDLIVNGKMISKMMNKLKERFH